MKNDIGRLMVERISAGLKRRTLTTCSRWSRACRVMGQPYPGPWSFVHHPWLEGMHDSEAEFNVGQKSAQMGYTEWALNRTFFMIDVKGMDCLYVLPAQTPDASDFSAARFDPALEMSPHLTKLFSDVQNVGHKRAGSANLYVRGSKSRSGLKSIPTGFIVLDEVDEMEQDNIPLAMERAAGQVSKQILAISTPTLPGTGINKMFMDTTQEHYFFTCPHCSRMTELTFPHCLVVTAEDVNDRAVEKSYLRCKECDQRLEHETKPDWLAGGSWVPEYSDRLARGFHVNQMYSCTMPPASLAKSYLRSQRDPAEEQEFYNSKLGLPHVVAGAGVTDADIDGRIGQSKRVSAYKGRGIVTMGVDVGKWLHVEIDLWDVPPGIKSVDLNVMSRPRLLQHCKVQHFEELDKLMADFGVNGCVIDANPERRKAYEFAMRHYGIVRLCFYGNSVQGKQIHVSAPAAPEPTITVDRTSWLDLSLGRFKTCGMIILPMDIDQEYRRHIKSPVRIYKKDANQNPVGRYEKGSDDDHYAHARNYAELALPLAASLGNPTNITGVY